MGDPTKVPSTSRILPLGSVCWSEMGPVFYLAAIAASFAVPKPPNIVMIFSDDHARQAISCYGSRLVSTPNIDQLAKEGARFDRHYTTNPLCAPSRATLLTGRSSHSNGIRDNASEFDGTQVTFPKLLQSAGYQTAVIGKWHLTSKPTGFDHWEVLPGQGSYYNPEFLTPRGSLVRHGYVTEVITQRALAWIANRGPQPFFLLVGHKAPHRNWVPGLNQLHLFADKTFPEPATLRTDYDGLVSEAKNVHMRLDRDIRSAEDLMVDTVPPRADKTQIQVWERIMQPQDEEYKKSLARSGDLLGTNYQRYVREYTRCVAGVDESVGEILRFLRKYRLLDNTVVVYSSDQGFFIGENGWYDKRWFYEPSAGTPLIVRPASGLGHSRSVKSLTSNLDFAPTFLDLAGIKPPDTMQGRSLVPLVKGVAPSVNRDVVYGHFYESNDPDHKVPRYVAVCTSRHKLIYYYDLQEWELFDLAQDAAETQNLWPDGVSRAVRVELLNRLTSQQRVLREDQALIRQVERAVQEAVKSS